VTGAPDTSVAGRSCEVSLTIGRQTCRSRWYFDFDLTSARLVRKSEVIAMALVPGVRHQAANLNETSVSCVTQACQGWSGCWAWLSCSW